MKDTMEVYRAYLSARSLADGLLAAHHDRDGRKHHLIDARREIEEVRIRLNIAMEEVTVTANAPA